MTSALGQKNMIPRTTLWVEYFPILIGKEIEVQRASLSDSKTCNWLRAELSFEISMFPKVTHLHHLLLGLGLFLCRVSSLLILQSASSSKNLQLCGAGFSTALHLYCMHSKCHPFIWPKLSSHKSWSPNSYLTLTSHHSSLLCPSTFCFCLPWFVHLFLALSVCSFASDSLRYVDCSPPGSSVHGILQTRMLEWVVILFFSGSSWPRNQTHISCIGRQIFFFYQWATWEATFISYPSLKASFFSFRPPMLFPSPKYPCANLTFSLSRLIWQLPESFLD